MYKRCVAFPSTYRNEFIKRKAQRVEPIRPISNWEPEAYKAKRVDNENQEELCRNLILDRYKTVYYLDYHKEFTDEKQEDEEVDAGSELIAYLKNLYYKPHSKEFTRVLYTTARVFGYSSPQTLGPQLSTYQDTYGRTGGKVILKNAQKMITAKRRQIIQSKLWQAISEE